MNSNIKDIHKRECEERLRDAAANGDIETIKSLIKMGVDVNSQNIINHWTPLHWSCKRGHSSVTSYLIDHGADPSIATINHETCWQLMPDSKFSITKTGKVSRDNESNNNSSPFVPNYLAHPIYPFVNQPMNNGYHSESHSQNTKHSTPSSEREFYARNFTTSAKELVVKIKLEKERDFIEVDFPDKDRLSYIQLLDEMCRELDIPLECSLKIRKLPNTIIRNDRDIGRLRDFQELELITHT